MHLESYRVAGLEYCKEPALAVIPASSTLRVSWWRWNGLWHVGPSTRTRTSHISSIHVQSARYIHEKEKEEEAGRRRYLYSVTTHPEPLPGSSKMGGQLGRHPYVFLFFLHCRTSARHGRSTTGLTMWLRSNFPKRKKPTTNPPKNKKTSNTHTHKPRHGPGKSVREICKLSETRWNIRAPLSLICSRPPCSTPPRSPIVRCQPYQYLHLVLRRVSYVWLQTSSLELIRVLPSLPPFCTILHECINLRLRYCFLVW